MQLPQSHLIPVTCCDRVIADSGQPRRARHFVAETMNNHLRVAVVVFLFDSSLLAHAETLCWARAGETS